MQHFTELGLGVTKARISSDGGWFVDVFEVQEAAGGPVTSEAKLSSIKRVSAEHCQLDVDLQRHASFQADTMAAIRPRR